MHLHKDTHSISLAEAHHTRRVQASCQSHVKRHSDWLLLRFGFTNASSLGVQQYIVSQYYIDSQYKNVTICIADSLEKN